MKDTTKTALTITIKFVLLFAVLYASIYCICWNAKNLYEENVRQTVQEMVKAECLNGTHNH